MTGFVVQGHVWKLKIQWLLLVFLIFSASLPWSDHFVLFDLLDVNGANVLCDIPVLRLNVIWIFGWNHSYCL